MGALANNLRASRLRLNAQGGHKVRKDLLEEAQRLAEEEYNMAVKAQEKLQPLIALLLIEVLAKLTKK